MFLVLGEHIHLISSEAVGFGAAMYLWRLGWRMRSQAHLICSLGILTSTLAFGLAHRLFSAGQSASAFAPIFIDIRF